MRQETVWGSLTQPLAQDSQIADVCNVGPAARFQDSLRGTLSALLAFHSERPALRGPRKDGRLEVLE
jgi:hypothetical protein